MFYNIDKVTNMSGCVRGLTYKDLLQRRNRCQRFPRIAKIVRVKRAPQKQRCPPFCKAHCIRIHHELLVSLVNVEDAYGLPWDNFKKAIKKYEDLGPSYPILDPDRDYRYPLLHWAAMLGKTDVVEYLINNGHPADLKSPVNGETALHQVVRWLYKSVRGLTEKRIIKFGTLTHILAAALFAVDNFGNTPLHVCAISYTQRHEPSPKALFYNAALEIMIDKVLQIEGRETSPKKVIDWQNNSGNTILHILTRCQEKECMGLVEKLLKNQANFTLKNGLGKTAFDLVKKNKRKVTELFQHVQEKQDTEYQSHVISDSHVISNSQTCSNDLLDTTIPAVGDMDEEIVWLPSSPAAASFNVEYESASTELENRPMMVSLDRTDTIVISDSDDDNSIPSNLKEEYFNSSESKIVAPNSLSFSKGLNTNECGADVKQTDHHPNLAVLLRKVGKESLIVENAQKSKGELTEKIEKSKQACKEFEKAQEQLYAERMNMEMRIENLMKTLQGHEKTIAEIDRKIKLEDVHMVELKNEIGTYDGILKCLS